MKTFWTRIISDAGNSSEALDMFRTGIRMDDEKEFYCFAVRANDEDEVHDMLAELLCGGSYEVDFIQETIWQRYKDFAGEGTRFPMADQYLNGAIDTAKQVLMRINSPEPSCVEET